MTGDLYARVMLTVIAACALALVASQLGVLPPREPPPEEPPARRYTLTVIRTGVGPALLRADTATGEIWRFDLRGGTDWELIGAEEEPAASPSPEEILDAAEESLESF